MTQEDEAMAGVEKIDHEWSNAVFHINIIILELQNCCDVSGCFQHMMAL